MKNRRVAVAVGLALLAAAAGALAWGLSEPWLGAVAAGSAVLAAAVASLDLPENDPTPPRPRPAPRSRPGVSDHPASTPDPTEAGAPRADELDEMPEPATPDVAANELVDDVTGMLDHRYFLVALERRVAASRRKLSPFSLVVVELHPDDPSRHRVADQSMKVLAAVCRAVLRDADTGCRIDRNAIGLLLEDTPEAGAVWATERVRAGFFATTFRGNVKMAAGIAAYPAHALEADRLLAAAHAAANRSHELGDESIQLATPDESSESQGG